MRPYPSNRYCLLVCAGLQCFRFGKRQQSCHDRPSGPMVARFWMAFQNRFFPSRAWCSNIGPAPRCPRCGILLARYTFVCVRYVGSAEKVGFIVVGACHALQCSEGVTVDGIAVQSVVSRTGLWHDAALPSNCMQAACPQMLLLAGYYICNLGLTNEARWPGSCPLRRRLETQATSLASKGRLDPRAR
jgi:hypothetical protein